MNAASVSNYNRRLKESTLQACTATNNDAGFLKQKIYEVNGGFEEKGKDEESMTVNIERPRPFEAQQAGGCPTSADDSEKRQRKLSKASASWQRLSLVLKESSSDSIGMLKQEMAELRDILHECRRENEELLHDVHVVFDENDCLNQQLDKALCDKAKLEDSNKSLSEQLEAAMLEIEEKDMEVSSLRQRASRGSFGSSGRRTLTHRGSFEGESADSASLSTGELCEEELSLQVAGIKAEMKRSQRAWELEQSRLLEQYKKDQIEKEALREVAQESFLKMRATMKENKKLRKEVDRSARRLALVDDSADSKQLGAGWGFVHRVMQRKDGTNSKKGNNVIGSSTKSMSSITPNEEKSDADCDKKADAGKSESNERTCGLDQSMAISFDEENSAQEQFGNASDEAALNEFHMSISSRVMELSIAFDSHTSVRSSCSSMQSSVFSNSRRRSSAAQRSFQHTSLQERSGLPLDEETIDEIDSELEDSDGKNSETSIEEVLVLEDFPAQRERKNNENNSRLQSRTTNEDNHTHSHTKGNDQESQFELEAIAEQDRNQDSKTRRGPLWKIPALANHLQKDKSSVRSLKDDETCNSDMPLSSRPRAFALPKNIRFGASRPAQANTPAA